MSRSTRRPPPPDPIDAADEALARARAANERFRQSDDFDEPTGRHEAQPFHVHFDVPREALSSVHDDAPKKNPVLAMIAGLGTLVLGLLAVAHALGLF